MSNYDDYFSLRNVSESSCVDYRIPVYLQNILPADTSARILDIGCGYGQILGQLKRVGYTDTLGIDVSRQAVEHCLRHTLNVEHISTLQQFCFNSKVKYSFIILSHVLEHLDKSEMIPAIELIRTHLLDSGGVMVIMVPNAQSNTGCYWAYEDFTHRTLFTAGSLLYVLKAAGFTEVRFLDPDGLEGANPVILILKKILLTAYKTNVSFWNRVTGSYFHMPSPQIFTYELKVLAK
jgi:SAM-dependent methyltransferase